MAAPQFAERGTSANMAWLGEGLTRLGDIAMKNIPQMVEYNKAVKANSLNNEEAYQDFSKLFDEITSNEEVVSKLTEARGLGSNEETIQAVKSMLRPPKQNENNESYFKSANEALANLEALGQGVFGNGWTVKAFAKTGDRDMLEALDDRGDSEYGAQWIKDLTETEGEVTPQMFIDFKTNKPGAYKAHKGVVDQLEKALLTEQGEAEKARTKKREQDLFAEHYEAINGIIANNTDPNEAATQAMRLTKSKELAELVRREVKSENALTRSADSVLNKKKTKEDLVRQNSIEDLKSQLEAATKALRSNDVAIAKAKDNDNKNEIDERELDKIELNTLIKTLKAAYKTAVENPGVSIERAMEHATSTQRAETATKAIETSKETAPKEEGVFSGFLSGILGESKHDMTVREHQAKTFAKKNNYHAEGAMVYTAPESEGGTLVGEFSETGWVPADAPQAPSLSGTSTATVAQTSGDGSTRESAILISSQEDYNNLPSGVFYKNSRGEVGKTK